MSTKLSPKLLAILADFLFFTSLDLISQYNAVVSWIYDDYSCIKAKVCLPLLGLGLLRIVWKIWFWPWRDIKCNKGKNCFNVY